MAKLPVCGDCSHRFDPADRRSFLPPTGSDLTPSCPACWQMGRGATAWAVWNSCNGVFEDMIFCRRKEAQEALAADVARSGDFGGEVLPVRVIVESEDRRLFRHWDEDEWTKVWDAADARQGEAAVEQMIASSDVEVVSGPAW